jgi:predicted ATP-dependent endonuclease of OLD family
MNLVELIAENFKILKAVRIRPKGPLTSIVGRNGAGKTSVLDAISAALGGGDECPDMPVRKGHTKAKVIVDLGDIVVERRWTPKGSTLEVKAKDGSPLKSPQAVLDRLVGQLSFDPLAFGRMTSKEQAATLARIAKIDLEKFKKEREEVFLQRSDMNRKLKDAEAQLKGMSAPVDAPDEEVSIAAVLDELKSAEKQHKDYQSLQKQVDDWRQRIDQKGDSIRKLNEQIEALKETADQAIGDCNAMVLKSNEFVKTLNETPQPPDLEPIRERGKQAQTVNKAVQQKKALAAKQNEVKGIESNRNRLTKQLEDIDAKHRIAIEKAQLPIPGLSLSDSIVTFKEIPLDQCSSAERLRVGVAIGISLNSDLKLMLIRDASLLDDEGMELVRVMAEEAGLQVFMERVDNGKEIGVRIVDGEADSEAVETKEPAAIA